MHGSHILRYRRGSLVERAGDIRNILIRRIERLSDQFGQCRYLMLVRRLLRLDGAQFIVDGGDVGLVGGAEGVDGGGEDEDYCDGGPDY